MNNSIKSSDTDSQDIDLLLENSASETSQCDTQALQARILSRTADMPQFNHSANLMVSSGLNKFKDWLSLPQFAGAAALAFTLVLAVAIWGITPSEVGTSEFQVAEDNPSTQALMELEFSMLSEREANMDEYQELIWQELLLAEDELAFAML